MAPLSQSDQSALARRLGSRISPEQASVELDERTTALKCFSQGDIFDPMLLDALLKAYIMLLENPARHSTLLCKSGLPQLLDSFLRLRLYENSELNNGWPLQSDINRLAVTLFFLLSSQKSIESESPERTFEIMEQLSPFTFAGFLYPCRGTPSFEYGTWSSSGFIPSEGSKSEDKPLSVSLYGRVISVRLPPIAPFAMLSYFCRLELREIGIPPHLPNSREEANATGRQGPTRNDVLHFITHCRTRLIQPGLLAAYGLMGHWRNDFFALSTLDNSSPFSDSLPSSINYYEPTAFDGRWEGSFIAPYMSTYSSWKSGTLAPTSFSSFARQPCYFTLREYYCYCPSLPVQSTGATNMGGTDWLKNCHWEPNDSNGGIDIFDDSGNYTCHYHPLRPKPAASWKGKCDPSEKDPRLMGALHVILAGRTEKEHGEAWGAYNVIGDIRPSDGLVTLLRDADDRNRPGLGRSLFQGYLISSQNFVGRWRLACANDSSPEWEAPFSLCKAISDTPTRSTARVASGLRRTLSLHHSSTHSNAANQY